MIRHIVMWKFREGEAENRENSCLACRRWTA